MDLRRPMTPRQRQIYDLIVGSIQQRGYAPSIREIGSQLDIRSTNGVADHLKALIRKGYLQQDASKSRTWRPLQPPEDAAGEASQAQATAQVGQRSRRGPAGPLRDAARPDPQGGGQNASPPSLRGRHAAAVSQRRLRRRDDAAAAPAPSLRGRAADTVARRSEARRPEADLQGLPGAGLRPASTGNRRLPLLGRVAGGLPALAAETYDEFVTVDASMLPTGGDLFALRVVGHSMVEAGIDAGDLVFVRRAEQVAPGRIVVALIDDEATVKYYLPKASKIVLRPANPEFSDIILRPSPTQQLRLLGEVVGVYRRL